MNQVVQSLKDYDFNKSNEKTYLIGDFNFDVSISNGLTRYLKSMNYIQVVDRATHLGGNVLDHVYIQEASRRKIEIRHNYVYYSDHDGIMVSLKEDAN